MRSDTMDLGIHPGVALSAWEPSQVPAFLRTIRELGYRRVVVPLRDFERLDAASIRAVCADHEILPITAGNQQPHADISSDDPEIRAAGRQRLIAMIEFTRAIGGDHLGGVIYGTLAKSDAPIDARRFERTARALGALAEGPGAEAGVDLVCEVVNRYETAMMNTAEQAMRFVSASESTRVKLHLDTFHMNIEESDPIEAVRIALPALAYLEIGQNHRGLLSDGHLDLQRFVSDAVALGYSGRFGVEAFSASVIAPATASALAIWRMLYDAENSIARDAATIVRSALAQAAR
ncbi:sugar phosphate isomerase/epimerase family protein [Humidisolicoccus flavus]|uniref:sugar phosphate isomerase/epimerase family protein n=1 Tax=Humidisolicoccus flavus TaxID=3111414 RepID=UPI00325670F3